MRRGEAINRFVVPSRVGYLLLAISFIALGPASAAGQESWPLTGAERSGWSRSTSQGELLEFLAELDARSDRVAVELLGRTDEGRAHPVVYLGAPPRLSPDGDGKPTLLILGSIHGNEPSGREGSLQFLREMAFGEAGSILDLVHVIVVPQMNPDGSAAGRRENAGGYDLNRDWIVAESSEVRGVLEGIVTRFWPEVFVDAHNGGAFPYHLTYQTTLDPTADPDLVAFARGPLLDAVRTRLGGLGMESFWYSGPLRDPESLRWHWRTTEPLPRKHHSYAGLQDMVALLLEVPGEHSLEIGAGVMREALLAIAAFTGEEGEAVRGVVAEARRRTEAGAIPEVYLELAATGHPELESFLVLPTGPERRRAEPERVEGENRTLYLPVRSRPTPWGYALEPEMASVAALLELHGIAVQRTEAPTLVSGEGYRIDAVRRSETIYQNHRLVEVDLALETQEILLPSGSFLVPVAQRGGRLIPQLLEPDAVDSVLRWNFLDDFLPTAGGGGPRLPIHRVLVSPPAD